MEDIIIWIFLLWIRYFLLFLLWIRYFYLDMPYREGAGRDSLLLRFLIAVLVFVASFVQTSVYMLNTNLKIKLL